VINAVLINITINRFINVPLISLLMDAYLINSPNALRQYLSRVLTNKITKADAIAIPVVVE
jgi:hypothetical protein